MPAKSLMIMGTASSVGKSVIVAGLCRAFARRGVRVAPFKSQNMSNNSAVCPGGGEIGRAQAAQAEACGLEPTVDMNPVLLKPEAGLTAQVVIRGQARFDMGFHDYERYCRKAWPEIVASYQSLRNAFDLVVIEGAGSAAEINLKNRDLANWAVAELADAPVLLVGDIDRGGVFASLVGTVELLDPVERRRICGFLINKFRGDIRLLDSGLRLLHERTGIPVWGVIPFVPELQIPEEDGVSLDPAPVCRGPRPVTIGVVKLPCISNFTDFAPFEREPDVTLRYLTNPPPLPEVDILVLPGTKSTVADLTWLRRCGWEEHLTAHLRDGRRIVGICGGYQMLGKRILDLERVESDQIESLGLGHLDVTTHFTAEKITAQVAGSDLSSGLTVRGYEIHAGRTTRASSAMPIHRLTERGGQTIDELEGAKSADGRIWGSSIHGLFDGDAFRRRFIDLVRADRQLGPLPEIHRLEESSERIQPFDRLADILEANVDFAKLGTMVQGCVRADDLDADRNRRKQMS